MLSAGHVELVGTSVTTVAARDVIGTGTRGVAGSIVGVIGAALASDKNCTHF